MKISLDQLDARGLRVDLGVAGQGGQQGEELVSIRSANGLKGTLEQHGDRLVLEGVTAARVELDALRLLLGDLVLAMTSGATLTGVALALDQAKEALRLQLTTTSLEAPALRVAVEDVVIEGRVVLTAPRLMVRGDDGSLSAERLTLADFALRIGGVEVMAETVVGSAVEIAWGEAGFRLVAGSFEAPSLRITAPDIHLVAGDVAVTALSLHGAKISIGRVALERGDLALSFAPPAAPAPATASVPPPAAAHASAPPGPVGAPAFDWPVLDALSGQLDVDVVVDLTVPIIGRRHATHRLRVAIADGAIDYRALEKNLSRLEDALLDFSVRDGALVLERVNPLFPARGHGKPVVVWDVDAAGLELAGRDRVRLAVLPHARLASTGDEQEKEQENPPKEASKSSFALRQLELRDINARLALAHIALPALGQVRPRHLGSLVLGGNVFLDPDGAPRPGSLLGELSDLALTLDGLLVGTTRLDVTSLTAAAVSPIEVAFTGIHPTKVQLGLSALVLEGVDIAT